MVIEVVPGTSNVCSYTSLSYDSSDLPSITYFDEGSDNTLKYVHWNGSFWIIPEIFDPSAHTNEESCVAIDDQGHAHVSYHDDNTDVLKHAERIGSPWNTEIVPGTSNVCSYTWLALDSFGLPGISYYDEGPDNALKYVHFNGNSWGDPTVLARAAEEASCLNYDSENNPGISYFDIGTKDLKFIIPMEKEAKPKANSWIPLLLLND